MSTKQLLAMALIGSVAVSACGGSDPDATESVALAQASAQAAPAGPTPTGTVIEVKMITDDRGNYFEPSTIQPRPGDVIRFVLVSGVHNFSLPADKNAAGISLPEPGELLQLPGHAQDFLVDLPRGEYYFQCDPHALLGMTGTITVGS